MNTIKIIKILGIIGLLFLLPSISNAQIQRVWNIAEYTSTILPPPATGTKVAYRTLNNSLFYWDGTQWKRLAGPGIVDTNYTISILGSIISLNGSGTNVDIAPYVSTSPTTIANTRIAVSDGSNLVGYSALTYNNSTNKLILSTNSDTPLEVTTSNPLMYVPITSSVNSSNSIIETLSKESGGTLVRARLQSTPTTGLVGTWSNHDFQLRSNSITRATLVGSTGNFLIGTSSDVPTSILTARSTTKSSSPFPLHTLAESDAITGVQGNFDYETTQNGLRWYNGTRKAYALESTFARGTATRIPFFDANGQITDNSLYRFSSATQSLILGAPATTTRRLNVQGNAYFFMDAGGATGFEIDNINNNNPFTLRGQNGQTAQFLPAAANFFPGNVSGSLFRWNNVSAYFGLNTSAYSILGKTIQANSISFGANGNADANIVDQGFFPLVMARNQSANISFLVLNGGKTTGTNSSMFSYPFRITGGIATGTGQPGDIEILTSDATTSGTTQQSTSLKWIIKGSLGRFSNADNPSYLFHLQSTDAIGLPRGTVGNQPSIASNTTPLRFFTDTAAIGYGHGGVYNFLATRPYVRTLASSSWLGPRLVAGDVTINAPWTSVLKIKQDTGFWALRRGVMFMGSPDKDTIGNDRTPSIFIMPNEADTAAAYMRASNSVWIGSRLGVNEYPSDGSVTIGYLNKNQSVISGNSYYSNVIGFLNESRGAIKSNIFGQNNLITKNDSHAYGFDISLTAFSTIGIGANIAISGANSVGFGRSITTTIQNRYTYGIGTSDAITHQMNGSLIVGRDSSLKFNQTAKTLQLSAYGTPTTTAAALSKTLTNYGVGFATDGTVTSRLVTTYGLYAGSGTLANHTTRALIPSTGNLLFSQTYNTTDSAYIQVINNLDGNREIRGGLTDTASTGFSKFRFYQDEADEEMGWEILTDDGIGTTAVGAQGGNLSLYADAAGTVEVRGQEIRLSNGEVLMNQYGQGSMKSTDLGVTDSKFVNKFATDGRVTDYYLARDTFIEDVTLFSVGTMMQSCQELTVVSSMTAAAPTHQEIRFPDAADELRGKKIIVYSKKKDAGSFVPQIKVVGGVSRLYFTTNPAIGGTDPSDQSTLSIDDSVWSDHGTTFEFTCLRIDNTPSYRWVLKQR